MKLKDLLKEIKAVPGGGGNILALVNKLKAKGDFEEGYKVIAYRESKFKTKNDEAFLVELLIQTKIKSNDGKSEFKIVEYFYYPEFNHFEYHNTYFDFYDPEGERLQNIIRDREFTKINPPITEIKAKPALKLPSGFDIEQAFYDFFDTRQVSPPKGKFNKDEQFLGIKYKMIDHLHLDLKKYHSEELIIFYFQVGGMFNEKFQVAYNLDDPYSPNKNYTKWLGYQEIDQIGLMKEIKAVPPRAHPLNIEKIWDFVSQDELKGELGPFDINKNYIGFEKVPLGTPSANMHFIKTYFRDNKGYPFKVTYSYNYGREKGYDFYNWWDMDEGEIPNDLLREIKALPPRAHPLNIEKIWDFVSQDELKGELGPFDIDKHYIGFKIRPLPQALLRHYPNKDVHLLGTYFRDNNGNPFSVIYSYNYGRENGYDFFDWRYENEDEIPNDLLREIKVTLGRLPFSSEEAEEELYKRTNLNTGVEDYLSYIGYTQENIEKNGLIIYTLYYKIEGFHSPEYLKIKIWYNYSNHKIDDPKIGTYEYDNPGFVGRAQIPFDKLIK